MGLYKRNAVYEKNRFDANSNHERNLNDYAGLVKEVEKFQDREKYANITDYDMFECLIKLRDACEDFISDVNSFKFLMMKAENGEFQEETNDAESQVSAG